MSKSSFIKAPEYLSSDSEPEEVPTAAVPALFAPQTAPPSNMNLPRNAALQPINVDDEEEDFDGFRSVRHEEDLLSDEDKKPDKRNRKRQKVVNSPSSPQPKPAVDVIDLLSPPFASSSESQPLALPLSAAVPPVANPLFESTPTPAPFLAPPSQSSSLVSTSFSSSLESQIISSDEDEHDGSDEEQEDDADDEDGFHFSVQHKTQREKRKQRANRKKAQTVLAPLAAPVPVEHNANDDNDDDVMEISPATFRSSLSQNSQIQSSLGTQNNHIIVPDAAGPAPTSTPSLNVHKPSIPSLSLSVVIPSATPSRPAPSSSSSSSAKASASAFSSQSPLSFLQAPALPAPPSSASISAFSFSSSSSSAPSSAVSKKQKRGGRAKTVTSAPVSASLSASSVSTSASAAPSPSPFVLKSTLFAGIHVVLVRGNMQEDYIQSIKKKLMENGAAVVSNSLTVFTTHVLTGCVSGYEETVKRLKQMSEIGKSSRGQEYRRKRGQCMTEEETEEINAEETEVEKQFVQPQAIEKYVEAKIHNYNAADDDDEEYKRQNRFFVLSFDWINECFSTNQLVDEDRYCFCKPTPRPMLPLAAAAASAGADSDSDSEDKKGKREKKRKNQKFGHRNHHGSSSSSAAASSSSSSSSGPVHSPAKLVPSQSVPEWFKVAQRLRNEAQECFRDGRIYVLPQDIVDGFRQVAAEQEKKQDEKMSQFNLACSSSSAAAASASSSSSALPLAALPSSSSSSSAAATVAPALDEETRKAAIKKKNKYTPPSMSSGPLVVHDPFDIIKKEEGEEKQQQHRHQVEGKKEEVDEDELLLEQVSPPLSPPPSMADIVRNFLAPGEESFPSYSYRGKIVNPNKFQCQKPPQSVAKVERNGEILKFLQKFIDIHSLKCNKQDEFRVKNYREAFRAVSNHPELITNIEDVNVPQKKIAKRIEEFLKNGTCERLQTFENDKFTKTAFQLMRVWGIGPKIASDMIRLHGIESIEALRSEKGRKLLSEQQLVGLERLEDIEQRIPREECEEIISIVQRAAAKIDPEIQAMACGSFRRGKQSSGDIDIIITKPNAPLPPRLLSRVVQFLHDSKFLTDHLALPETMEIASRKHEADQYGSNTTDEEDDVDGYVDLKRRVGRGRKPKKSAVDDSFEGSYMGICKPRQIHRRIDLRAYSHEQLPFALLYFTGSDLFNRSMRLWARFMGFSLSDKGICACDRDAKSVLIREGSKIQGFPSEESIFFFLGLRYRRPQDRSM